MFCFTHWLHPHCNFVLALLLVATIGNASENNFTVSDIAFDDLDLDLGELGGVLAWMPPSDASTINTYQVGLATDASGASLIILSNTPVGTNSYTIAAGTEVGSSSYIVIYTMTSPINNEPPAAIPIEDASATVSGVECVDEDLDATQLGGAVTWTPPSDESNVTHYTVYLATNVLGLGRSQVGSELPVGTNLANLAADTPINLYNSYVVYTKSSFAEQSVPGATAIVDTVSPVTNLLFIDQDLDLLQLGGTVTWTEPANAFQVEQYNVYWSENPTGIIRASVGTIANSTNEIFIAADTAKTSKTHILVYSRSALAEQTTPVAHAILDRSSSVSVLSFPDKDLDAGELGGDITFIAPVEHTQVTHYVTYFALSGAGVGKSQLGDDIPVATDLPTVPMNTSKGSFSYFVVYTKSAIAEQTTPVNVLIQDNAGGVVSVTFIDKDLDAAELGGTVTWTAPSTVQVVNYNVYFATSTDGDDRMQTGTAVPVHTNALVIPANTSKDTYTHLVVYAESSLGEQNTPSFNQIADITATVGNVQLVDYDLDTAEVGGSVTWSAPGDASQVMHYRAFLATSAEGASRSKIGEDIAVGTNLVPTPMNTNGAGFTHVVVYTKSDFAEQGVPANSVLSNADGTVSNVVFVDRDLDMSDVGGTVTWTAPTVVSQVTYYAVYLATNAAGTTKSLIGSDPNGMHEGTNAIALSADTPVGSRTHVVVFSRSALAEQTTPRSLSLVDRNAPVPNVQFTDLDLDATDLGGALSWDPATDVTLVTHYTVYLAAGAGAGAVRSQLGSALAVGTNSLSLLADTPLGSHTHFAIHARSTLAEQTTPGGTLEIDDNSGSVIALSFGDRDFDVGQIGGVIQWQPPLDVTQGQVAQYAVYRAKNAAGSGKVQIGSDVAVGTNLVTLTVSTQLDDFTHMVVYSKNSMGAQSTPAAVLIGDTPEVGVPTQWTIGNADSTTPRANGRASTAEVGLEWNVHELQFYSDTDCTQPVTTISQASSGQTGKYHGPSAALDGSEDTAWKSQCAPCTAFEAFVGIVTSDIVLCIRWLQASILTGSGSPSVALQIGGQELARLQGLKGGHWEGLRYAAAAGGWQRIQ